MTTRRKQPQKPPKKGGTVVPPSDFQSVATKSTNYQSFTRISLTGAQTQAGAHAHARANKTAQDILVLVACEESQAVCLAFRERGFTAFSADLQECSGQHPELHILGDVQRVLNGDCDFNTQDGQQYHINGQWHCIIAHPPCTYLSMVSASNSIGGILNNKPRLEKMRQAAQFFRTCLDANAHYLAVENPVPLHVANLPRPTTVIQPYEHGEPWSKRTCLWLKNLPPIFPTIYAPKHRSWTYCTRGGKKRSKTFKGIAKAMAEQWGEYMLTDINNNTPEQ